MKNVSITFTDLVDNGSREFIENVVSVETSVDGATLAINLKNGSIVSYPWMVIRSVKVW